MRLVAVEQLGVAAEVGDRIYGARGQLLLKPGARLTAGCIRALGEQGVPAVYVADPDTADVLPPEPIKPETRELARRALTEVFEPCLEAGRELRELSLAVAQQHAGSDRFASAVRAAFGGGGLRSVHESVDALLRDLLGQSVLVGLNSIKVHDGYTFQHSIDVTIMGVVLARRAGWDAARVRSFGIGCMLHDLGKVLIPPEILNKPGRLTEAEFEVMKTHPTLGFHLVRALAPNLGGLVAHVAYQHHERQDGSGYPRGLRGTNVLGQGSAGKIHDFGALAAVADVYDAMSSTRPYRVGWAPDKVVAAIASMAGTHLNRAAVEVFLSVATPYPVCSEVVLLNGRYTLHRGVVARVCPDELSRPVVRLLYDASGRRISPVDLDLRVERDVEVRSYQPREPEVESMGGRRRKPRPAAPLPLEVQRACDSLLQSVVPPAGWTPRARRRIGGYAA